MKANNQMSNVLSNFNMPLQIQNPSVKAFRQFDYPIQQTQSQQQLFQCKKIEKDIGVISNESYNKQDGSILLNILSGRQISSQPNLHSLKEPEINQKNNQKKKPYNYELRNKEQQEKIKTGVLQSNQKKKNVEKSQNQSKTRDYDRPRQIPSQQARKESSLKRPSNSKTSKLTQNLNSELINIDANIQSFKTAKEFGRKASTNNSSQKFRPKTSSKKSHPFSQPLSPSQFSNTVSTSNNIIISRKSNQLRRENSNQSSSLSRDQFSTIKRTNESLQQDDVSNQYDIQSIFPQSKYQQSQMQSNKKQRKDLYSDDKENVCYLSNQKQNALNHKKQSVYSSTDNLLTGDIIEKLRIEVQKQVKNREKKQKAEEQNKLKLKIQQQQIKHIASMIPLDQKVKIKQQRESNAQKQFQQELVKQRNEYDQAKKQRMKIKIKREQERKENMLYIDLLRKSISNSPSRKRPLKEQDINFRYQEGSNQIRVENVENNNDELRQNSLTDNYSSNNELHDLRNLETKYQNFLTIPQEHNEGLRQYQVSQNVKKSPYISPQKFQKMNFAQSDLRCQMPLKVGENNNGLKQYRHQQLENYLKEQKLKRIKNKKESQKQEVKKFEKLQFQLKTLQRDYFKGLEDFKSKQRAQSDKRQNDLKKDKKKKKKSKKHNQNRPQSLNPPNRIEYDLINQRNSMPQMLLQSPPQLKSNQITLKQRASFQSPQQYLRPMTTYENFNPMQSEDALSYQSQLTPNQSNKNFIEQIQTMQLRDSLNSQSNMPLKLRNQINLPSQRSQLTQQYGIGQKKCSLFSNESMKSFQDFQSNINTNETATMMNQRQMSQADFKNGQKNQILEFVSQNRKTLEQQLKNQKKSKQEGSKQINVLDYAVPQKQKSNKKKPKTKNLPLKVTHEPIGMQNIPKVNQQTIITQSTEINTEQNQTDLTKAKQQIIEKLQQVALRVQKHFTNQQIIHNMNNPDVPLRSPQQTLLLSQTNIIKEEESKEVELTATNLSPQRKSIDQKFQIINEVSQIPQNAFEEEPEQIDPLSNKNNNTTFLLKRFYQFEQPGDIQKQEQSAQVIQKHYRGYICRKIMKEKLRIDKEFRMLRQKYEVRSNATSSKSLMSSLAFSQSKQQLLTSQHFSQFQQKSNAYQQDSIYPRINNPLLQSQQNQQLQVLSEGSSETPFSQQQIGQIYNNQSEQFYQQDDLNNKEQHIHASVFISPSIEDSSSRQRESQQFDLIPTQLQFQDSGMASQNLIHSQNVNSVPVQQEIIEEAIEEFKDQSFINEEDTQRSQLPIDDESPFITKTSKPLGQIQQNNNLPTTVILQSIIIKLFQSSYDHTPKLNLENQPVIDSNRETKDFLDSPLKMNDLHASDLPMAAPLQIKPLKRLVPRPSKNEEQKQAVQNKKTEKVVTPIDSQSPQSQLLKQKSSIDLSSLINYADDQLKSSRQGDDQNHIKLNDMIKNIVTDHEFSDGSPIVIEDDQSPSNHYSVKQHQSFSRKDDSINTSVFEKNSFQQFAKDKINKVYKAEAQIEKMIEDLNKALKKKIKIRHQELQEQDLSVRTYNRKKVELEKWVDKEKKEIKMTKRHFMQGCVRLSSLLDNFVKEQDRVKDAVSSIRKQASNNKLRQSHSFDSELQKQNQNLQSHLFEGQEIQSNDLNTVSCRRQSSIEQNSSSYTPINGEHENEKIEEMQSKPKPRAFEYQIQSVPGQANSSKNGNNGPGQNSFEEVKLIEIKAHSFVQVDQHKDTIFIDEKQNKRNSLDEFSNLEDLSQSKLPSENHIFGSQDNNDHHPEIEYYDDNNLLKLSDTPIYGGTKDIKFPDEVQSLENLEKEEEYKVDILVEEILQHILLRETKERLFPPRALGRKLLSQSEHDNISLHHEKKEQVYEDQIKVLDNILEELNPDQDKQHEIEIEEEKVEELKFEESRKKGIESGMMQVHNYMHEIFTRIKNEKAVLGGVLENVSQPLYKDPILILAHLQNSFPEPPPSTESDQDGQQQLAYESPMPYQQSVLSVDLYLDIEKDRRGGLSISQMKDSFQESNSQSFVAEMENIHNKAIFDAVNEALDGLRPYGLRGPPLPWSKQSKTLTFKYGKEETLEYLLSKVKYKVLEWSHINAGTMAPQNLSPRSKDRLEMIREDKLAKILIQEAEENEPLWTDYEYEETQTKLDVADLVLEELCRETVDILNKIKQK